MNTRLLPFKKLISKNRKASLILLALSSYFIFKMGKNFGEFIYYLTH
jgi:hypothetical protein